MKIIIVGGTSSISAALLPVLSATHTVLTAGRSNCDITVDLTADLEKISFPQTDVVIHTAAHFGGIGIREIAEAESVNVLGTIKVCNAAIEAKARHVILISSIFATLKPTARQFNIYALSKKHSEEVAHLMCSAHSISLTVLRPSQIYGTGESYRRHQPFLYDIIDKAQSGEDVELYGSNDAKRNYIYIDDLVNIITRVVESRIEGIFSCTHPENTTYSQIAKAAFTSFDSKAAIRFLTNKPNIPDNIFEQDTSLYEYINYFPAVSIEQGIENIKLQRITQK